MLNCKICGYKARSLAGYVSHYRFHRNIKNLKIPCPFDTCSVKLSSYKAMTKHIQRDHTKEGKSQLYHSYEDTGITLQCSDIFCQKKFSTVKTRTPSKVN